MSTEERFVDLEIKLAHQEDMVESLNQVVYQQSKRIDQLEDLLHKLAAHIRANASGSGISGAANEKPPHY